MNSEHILKLIVNSLLAIVGFLLVWQFQTMNTRIVEVQSDIVEVKLQVVQLQERLIDEQKIRSIANEEIIKYFSTKTK